MRKIETAELIGPALDWSVAKCEESSGGDNAVTWLKDYLIGFSTRYSTTWSQGGPIIERERITVTYNENDGCWEAYYTDGSNGEYERGITALIAAMRCYVSSKIGEFVEIPDELI